MKLSIKECIPCLKSVFVPTITPDQALTIAKDELQKRGNWGEPVQIRRGLLHYYVRPRANLIGGHIIVKIKAHNGSITKVHITPM